MAHILRRFALCAAWIGCRALPATFSPPASPTVVYVNFVLNGLRKINAVDSTFVIDLYISLAWRDDRLVNHVGGTFDATTYWSPVAESINVDDSNTLVGVDTYTISYPEDLPEWIRAHLNVSALAGSVWLTAVSRKTGAFVADLNLEDFPFDRQNATIMLESNLWPRTDMVWQPVGMEVGMSPKTVVVGGWDMIGVVSTATPYDYPSFGQVYDRLIVSKVLRRQYGYYLSRVVSNMLLLMAMAFAATFLPLHERTGLVQASFLGIVSWLFVLSQETPKVGYLTRLDAFTQMSFAVLALLYLHFALHKGFYRSYEVVLRAVCERRKAQGTPGTGAKVAPDGVSGAEALRRIGADSNGSFESGIGGGGAGAPQHGGPGAAARRFSVGPCMCDQCQRTGGLMGGVHDHHVHAGHGDHGRPADPAPVCDCWPFTCCNRHVDAHQALDLAVTSLICLAYTVATAEMIGTGVANSNSGTFL